MTWQDDKAKTDPLLPDVASIMGRHLFRPGSREEDVHWATDMVLDGQFAVRIREWKFLRLYPGEFTIRRTRPNGRMSERDKIVAGKPTHLFYGVAAPDWTSLAWWVIVDLFHFRLWFHDSSKQGYPGFEPGEHKANRDGSSDFLAYKIDDLPADVVHARSGDPLRALEKFR